MSYFETNENRIVEDLVKLIAIPSVSLDIAQVERALDLVLDIANEMGMRTNKLLNGRVGVIEIGTGEETLGILTHVDVVDTGDLQAWEAPPYGAPVTDGKIIGRGALDDKGPIIAVLHAMKAALENNRTFKRKVRLIIGTQEEVEWSDMRDYVKQYSLPDFGFTPDGVFPISNIEKGYMDVLFRFPVEKRTKKNETKEQTNSVISIEKIWGGEASNVLPEKCQALLSDGRTLTPVLLKTSDSFVELTVNIRFAYGIDVEKMKKRLSELADENGGIADFLDVMQAVFVSKHEPFIQELAAAYEEVTGKKNDFVLAMGTSYAKVMPRIVSWGPILPEMEDTCHEANEYIMTKDLITNGKIYYSAICKIAQQ